MLGAAFVRAHRGARCVAAYSVGACSVARGNRESKSRKPAAAAHQHCYRGRYGQCVGRDHRTHAGGRRGAAPDPGRWRDMACRFDLDAVAP